MNEAVHLVVTGPMAVGKTATTGILAERLGRPRRDSDTDLLRLTGGTGAELVARLGDEGIDELHRLESAVLLGALADDRPSVIAAAGWVVEDARCREALARRAVVVVLGAPVEVLLERIAEGDHRRSVDRSEIESLRARRTPLEDEVADLRLDARRSPAELAAAILADPAVAPLGFSDR